MEVVQQRKWAVALENTPFILVKDTAAIVEGRNLIHELVRMVPFDGYFQWDEIRVSRPGTRFEILKVIRTDVQGVLIYVVRTDDYPCGEDTFITDSRFLGRLTTEEPPNRIIALPDQEVILDNLEFAEREKAKYVWAGQCLDGARLLELYPSAMKDDFARRKLSQKGLDCSGYLTWATNGFTPPSTNDMIHYGQQLEIEDLEERGIISILQPLDVIVWPGHMGIVGRDGHVYQSILRLQQDGSYDGGVEKVPVDQFLKWVMKERGKKPVDSITEENAQDSFVISRWHGVEKDPRFWERSTE